MLQADFTDKLSEGQIKIINGIINDNVGKFVVRSQLVWLGDAAFQTPDVFKPESLLVWLEGQEITLEGINGINIVAPNAFQFKLPHTVTENNQVTCYYNLLLPT